MADSILRSPNLQRGTSTTIQGLTASETLGIERSEYGDMILEIYRDEPLYEMFASPEISQNMPGNSGANIIQWWRYPDIKRAARLAEGTPPDPQDLERERVTTGRKLNKRNLSNGKN